MNFDWIDQAITDLCEIPDRNSPEDQPEMLLVTADEIREALDNRYQELIENSGLQFIEQDDGVINIKHESGDAIGDLVKRDGVHRLTFMYTYDNANGLYQIADKLKQLNGDTDA